MECNSNMCLKPAPSRRGSAARIVVAIAIVLAVMCAMMWGETWAIEHSAEFVPWFPPAQSSGALDPEHAANALPIAMLH